MSDLFDYREPAVYAALRYDGIRHHRLCRTTESVDFCRLAIDKAAANPAYAATDCYGVYDLRTGEQVFFQPSRAACAAGG